MKSYGNSQSWWSIVFTDEAALSYSLIGNSASTGGTAEIFINSQNKKTAGRAIPG